MGQTTFFQLVKGQQYGSYGFDSCIGVLIYGSKGTIIGHYPCSSESLADAGELGGLDQAGNPINPRAAKYAIPAAKQNADLGTGIKSYIFAQEG